MIFSVPDNCDRTERDALTWERQVELPIWVRKSEHTKLSVRVKGREQERYVRSALAIDRGLIDHKVF